MIGLGQEGVGENCLRYLKRGWNRKKGRGNKDFKKGDQAGTRAGSLKKGVTGTPLRTMTKFKEINQLLFLLYNALLKIISIVLAEAVSLMYRSVIISFALC